MVATTRIQLLNCCTPLHGTVIQSSRIQTGAVDSSTSLIPSDDTIPQVGEGFSVLSAIAIVPSSKANLLNIKVVLQVSNTIASNEVITAVFQDGAANAITAAATAIAGGNNMMRLPLDHLMIANTIVSTSFAVRLGGRDAGTTTLNGSSAVRRFGGVCNSSFEVQEVMT